MTDKRPLLVLVLVLALMGGLYYVTQGQTTDPVAASDEAVTEVSSAPSASTPPSTAGSTPPSATGNVSDWQAGLAEVNRLENAAFRAPDPSLVAGFMTRNCGCYQDTVTRLTALAAAKQRVAGDNIVIKKSVFVNQPSADRVVVVATLAPGGFPVVDAKGAIVEASPKSADLPLSYTLDKSSDGVWRIADRKAAGE